MAARLQLHRQAGEAGEAADRGPRLTEVPGTAIRAESHAALLLLLL